MKAARLVVAVMLVATIAGCRPRPEPEAPRWSRVKTPDGVIEVPPGWYVWVTGEDIMLYMLYSPSPALEVVVLYARDLGMASRDAARFQLKLIGAPAELELAPRPHHPGWHGEALVESDRIFAACAVPYGDRTDRVVLAVARLFSERSVDLDLYREAGGQATLCRIVDSVAELTAVN